VNPAYLSTLARVIQIILPQFSRCGDAPQQCLWLRFEQGQISISTTQDGLTMRFSGDAEEVVTVISAKMLNIEIEVSEAPGITGAADMVFVAKSSGSGELKNTLSFKCVYLPRSAPTILQTR
jgi:hypothetical protein